MATKGNVATRSTTNLEELILNVEGRITTKFELLLKETRSGIEGSISSVKAEIGTITSKVNELDNLVSQQQDEVNDLRTEVTQLKHNLSEQATQFQNTLLLKEVHERRPNLLFYGIPELAMENTERRLRQFFVEDLRFAQDKADDIYFKTVHRLPRKPFQNDPTPDAPNPILATFVYMPDRENVLSSGKLLKDVKGKSIRTDLPFKMKKQRAILNRKAFDLRRERVGLYARVRIAGVDVILETKDSKEPKAAWKRYT